MAAVSFIRKFLPVFVKTLVYFGCYKGALRVRKGQKGSEGSDGSEGVRWVRRVRRVRRVRWVRRVRRVRRGQIMTPSDPL